MKKTITSLFCLTVSRREQKRDCSTGCVENSIHFFFFFLDKPAHLRSFLAGKSETIVLIMGPYFGHYHFIQRWKWKKKKKPKSWKSIHQIQERNAGRLSCWGIYHTDGIIDAVIWHKGLWLSELNTAVLTLLSGSVYRRSLYMIITARLLVEEPLFLLFTNE